MSPRTIKIQGLRLAIKILDAVTTEHVKRMNEEELKRLDVETLLHTATGTMRSMSRPRSARR